MGHRSYLYLSKKNEDIDDLFAFEANNSLPFFWLTLIDSKTLENKAKEWLAYENYTDEEIEEFNKTNTLNFRITLEKLEQNSARGMSFLGNHFPESIPLYTDFITALKKQFKQEYTLEIEIDQISAFYESTEEYIEVLTQEIKAIEEHKPEQIRSLDTKNLISTGTGFDSSIEEKFADLPSYKNALNDKNLFIPRQQNKYKLKSLIYHIIILLLCPVVSYAIFRGVEKEGFSFKIIILTLCNIGFYIYSIWEISTQIKAAYTETGT